MLEVGQAVQQREITSNGNVTQPARFEKEIGSFLKSWKFLELHS
jgi:hypothetical protein